MNRTKTLRKWLLPAVTTILVILTLLLCYNQRPQPLILQTLEFPAAEEGKGCLDLNTATVKELEALPGIGPALAEKLLSWREENGPFTCREDILSINGIGEATYETIKPYISFG